jgi:hypothetical protein
MVFYAMLISLWVACGKPVYNSGGVVIHFFIHRIIHRVFRRFSTENRAEFLGFLTKKAPITTIIRNYIL